jgi:hypothetical protein
MQFLRFMEYNGNCVYWVAILINQKIMKFAMIRSLSKLTIKANDTGDA